MGVDVRVDMRVHVWVAVKVDVGLDVRLDEKMDVCVDEGVVAIDVWLDVRVDVGVDVDEGVDAGMDVGVDRVPQGQYSQGFLQQLFVDALKSKTDSNSKHFHFGHSSWWECFLRTRQPLTSYENKLRGSSPHNRTSRIDGRSIFNIRS